MSAMGGHRCAFLLTRKRTTAQRNDIRSATASNLVLQKTSIIYHPMKFKDGEINLHLPLKSASPETNHIMMKINICFIYDELLFHFNAPKLYLSNSLLALTKSLNCVNLMLTGYTCDFSSSFLLGQASPPRQLPYAPPPSPLIRVAAHSISGGVVLHGDPLTTTFKAPLTMSPLGRSFFLSPSRTAGAGQRPLPPFSKFKVPAAAQRRRKSEKRPEMVAQCLQAARHVDRMWASSSAW